MTKNDLSKEVAQKLGMTRKNADAAVSAVLDTIVESLRSGDKVQLVGFGTFEVKERAAREIKSPRTGEIMTTKASRYPCFKAGKAFKDQISE